MRSGGGPDLPYTVVAGVTPCFPGWLVASAKLNGATFAPEEPRVIASFVDVLDQRPSFSVVALDAPVGYPDEAEVNGRTCDRRARDLLGPSGWSVEGAPTRASMEAGIDRPEDDLDGPSTELLSLYRQVAAEMAPYRQRTVYEVHPELSFYQLNGDVPLSGPRESEEGQQERRSLLEATVPGVGRILDAELDGVSPASLMEAAACLWTARRIAAHAGTRLPADPEWDAEGLRMEIIR